MTQLNHLSKLNKKRLLNIVFLNANEKSVSVFSALLTVALFSSEAYAATGTAYAKATIGSSLEISKDVNNEISSTGGDLDFGIIIADASDGTVMIDPTDKQRKPNKKTLIGNKIQTAHQPYVCRDGHSQRAYQRDP